MKVIVAGRSLRRLMRWTRNLLIACAVVLLGYCTFAVVESHLVQRREQRHLAILLQKTISAPSLPQELPVPADGALVGRLEISRLAVSVMVMEGTSDATLRRAAGHIAGTALPGKPGNVGISAHRDTFFRPLRNIRRDDVITLTTLLGEFRYRVVSTRIVRPTDVSVLDPGEGEQLTMVTCYPFYFIGPAPSRFIVRAERVI